jgi:hypothetical protein
MSQLKLSSFYGDRLARPYVLLDKEGNALKGRVEAPAVNDALIGEWGRRAAWRCERMSAGPQRPCARGWQAGLCAVCSKIWRNTHLSSTHMIIFPHCSCPSPAAEWASKVPVGRGGTLVKPEWDGPEAAPKQARTDFQIFFQERFDDVLAASPAMFGGASDRKAMLAAASIYWRENLSPEERAAYHARALAEKQAQAEQIAEVRVGFVAWSGRHWLAIG